MLMRLSAMVCLPLVLACADATQIRGATYPRSFHYITEGEIHGTMGDLAHRVDALERIMAAEELGSAENQQIVALLSEMRSLAAQLKRGERSNHPRIDANAPRLEERIRLALQGVRQKPPNYYYAGTVSAACTYCHAPRQETAPPAPLPLP